MNGKAAKLELQELLQRAGTDPVALQEVLRRFHAAIIRENAADRVAVLAPTIEEA